MQLVLHYWAYIYLKKKIKNKFVTMETEYNFYLIDTSRLSM